jgi:hypothetical protein
MTPKLLAPDEGAQFSHYPRTTTVSWSSVPWATAYKVEVDMGNYKGAEIKWTKLLGRTVTGTSCTFDFVGSQPGRWRVTALDTTGAHQQSHPSPWRTFDYSVQRPVLPTPALISPAEGARFWHYPRTTTLVWKAVPGASQYQIEIDHGVKEASGIAWQGSYYTFVTGTSHTFDFVGSQPGRWRVTALDTTQAYQPSKPSPWHTFDFSLPGPALPTPALVSPAEGARFSNFPRATTVAWEAVQGADQYRVDVEYAYNGHSGLVWDCNGTKIVTETSLTFDFVGCQPGRWRVTALDSRGGRLPSAPSPWRSFSYSV